MIGSCVGKMQCGVVKRLPSLVREGAVQMVISQRVIAWFVARQ